MTAPETGGADIGHLATEAVRPELEDLDLLSSADLVALMVADTRRAVEAVAAAAPAIADAVAVVCQRLGAGGRLVYVGAGSAGRLAVLDAAELGPTFDVPEGMVEAVLAGGDGALRRASEGAEDDGPAGAAAMAALGVSAADVVIGVSASGRTPYVLGAIEQARRSGASTIGLSANAHSLLSTAADHAVDLVVGGEIVAGSSRLNAGTAQKIALNTISTAAMVQLGKTYGNLMVDVRATNTKLRDRASRIVQTVAGVGPARAVTVLEQAGWQTKLACLMAATDADRGTAQAALDAEGGRLRAALGRLAGAQPSAGAEPTGGAVRSRSTGGWRRLGVGAALVEGTLVPGDVAVHDGRVVAVGLPGGGSSIAAPGLVDLQVNGYAGFDAEAASVDELACMGEALARDGVLAYQPTLITSDPVATRAALARVARAAALGQGRSARGALLLGAHVEGPFLSPERLGTHPRHWLRLPDTELAASWLAAGPVTMVTLAPELPGALAVIAALSERGVVVSLGHSAAQGDEVAAAVAAGATAVTHLFNGMGPISARSAGLAGTALSDPRLRLQVIADGVHVATEMLLVVVAAAPGRWSIVTDATSVAGLGDGSFMLGQVPIERSGGVARRPDGTMAGGASSLLHAVRHLCSLSVGLADVLAAASERPAQLMGRPDVGLLRPGGPADLIVLDDGLELTEVLVEGRPLDR